MSVLSDLFADIAAAIRSKNGEEGTMKPAQFPGKISALTVANAENTGLKFAEGVFTPNATGGNTIEHGMGVIPDVIVIFPGQGGVLATDTEHILTSIGFSQAALDATGALSTVYLPNSSGLGAAYPLTDNTQNMVSMGMPRGATTTTFCAGGGTYTYSPEVKYRWVAFGNLFNA